MIIVIFSSEKYENFRKLQKYLKISFLSTKPSYVSNPNRSRCHRPCQYHVNTMSNKFFPVSYNFAPRSVRRPTSSRGDNIKMEGTTSSKGYDLSVALSRCGAQEGGPCKDFVRVLSWPSQRTAMGGSLCGAYDGCRTWSRQELGMF